MNVYVVSTPYHILSALLDVLELGKRSTIVLISNYSDDYTFFKLIVGRLRSFPNVKRVMIVKPRGRILRLFGYASITHSLDQEEVDRIVLFSWNLEKLYSNDNYFFKHYCGKKQIDLFEDGSNVYLSHWQTSLTRKIMIHLAGFVQTQKAAEVVQSIKVTSPDKFPVWIQPKLEKRVIVDELKELAESDRLMISRVFLSSNQMQQLRKISQIDEVNILFTQPLARDGFVSTHQQIQMYNQLIEEYSADNFLVVKQHPRDLESYSLSSNCLVLAGKFPSELLTSFGFRFHKSIGINSSAVRSVNSTEYVEKGLL